MDYLSRLYRQTAKNKQQLEQTSRQRRQTETDTITPYYFKGEYDSENDIYIATHYMPISSDFDKWNRFQFKAYVSKGNDSLHNDFKLYIDNHDITEQLKDLQIIDGKRTWICDPVRADGVYPSREIEEVDPSTDIITPYYDIIQVASYIANQGAEGSERRLENIQLANDILFNRIKKIQITSSAEFEIFLYLYVKYSQIGR